MNFLLSHDAVVLFTVNGKRLPYDELRDESPPCGFVSHGIALNSSGY